MSTKNKNKLALKSLLFGFKVIFTRPLSSLKELWDWAITPLADEQLNREKQCTLPPELANAYTRDWSFTTLSDQRKAAGKKGGEAKTSKTKKI